MTINTQKQNMVPELYSRMYTITKHSPHVTSAPCTHQAIYANLWQAFYLKTLLTPLTSRYIKRALQLLNQRPLVITNIRSVELLQSVDTLPRDQRVQGVLFFPVSTVDRLVGAFDLDRDGGLAALDHGDLFVVTLD